MSLKLISAPAAYPVTLAEAKLHLRVDGSDEDPLITAYIAAAAAAAEQATGLALLPQTWEVALDVFEDTIALTRIPVASVVSVKYVDTAGTIQTLDSAQYTLDVADDYGHAAVRPAWGAKWPVTRDQPQAVAVRYTAGYPDAASVPSAIKVWIQLMIGAMYENRQAEGTVQTYALGYADRLLDPYKVWGL